MTHSDVPGKRSDPFRPKNYWWISIKSVIRNWLRRLPLLEPLAVTVWQTAHLFFLHAQWNVRRLVNFPGSNIDLDQIYWVLPGQINWCALKEFNFQQFKGRVIGGDWDKLEKPFETLDVYLAFKQVMTEGISWADTLFYQHILEELAGGSIIWGCKTRRDFDERCNFLEKLYREIEKNGYKTQRQLLAHRYNPRTAAEITVSVGRNGDLLFSDGAHRLAIAKLLGLDRIPVQVTVRHAEWVKNTLPAQRHFPNLANQVDLS